MSNKTTTNTTTASTYAPAGMTNYNSFQGQLGNLLTQYTQNPLQSSFFNQQAGMAMNNASQIGQRNISNTLSNAKTGGGILGNSGAFMQSNLNRAMLQNSANQSSAWNGALTNALNTRSQAMGMMEAYQPLQTGQNSNQTTQQQMGLGSILGSVAGMGLNMAMPGIGSMLGGNSFGAGYSPFRTGPSITGLPTTGMTLPQPVAPQY